jgi:hypothetical protein
MTKPAMQTGFKSALPWSLLAAVVVALSWLPRQAANAEDADRLTRIAGDCPRWVRLAEELLAPEGGAPTHCEYVSGPASGGGEHVYKAGENIEVRVNLASDGANSPDSVIIRDVHSRASVTYNAEALALVK